MMQGNGTGDARSRKSVGNIVAIGANKRSVVQEGCADFLRTRVADIPAMHGRHKCHRGSGRIFVA